MTHVSVSAEKEQELSGLLSRCDDRAFDGLPILSTHAETAARLPGRTLLIALWVSAMSAIFVWTWRYDLLPGSRQATPPQWPETEILAAQPAGTCLMFAHPRCPCTRASLHQLQENLAGQPHWRTVQLVLFRPRTAASDWETSDIVRMARDIPQVQMRWDDDGKLAQRFGIETSGHVLLYDAAGLLQFSGGITAFRGHIGPNQGADILASLGHGHVVAPAQTPVYGCSLRTPSAAAGISRGEVVR